MVSFNQASVTCLPSVMLQLAVWLLVTVMPHLFSGLAETCATVNGWGSAYIADQFPDVLLLTAFEQLAHLRASLAAFFNEISADEGDVFIFVAIDAAV